MKIILFDANDFDRKVTRQIIDSWINSKHCTDIIVKEYACSNELEFELPDILWADAFILEIADVSGSTAGFSIAEKIRAGNPTANIIFVTKNADYWSKAFDISALHYLIKPLEPYKIIDLLKSIYASPTKRFFNKSCFFNDGEHLIVDLDKIIFIEASASRHSALIHMVDKGIINIHLADHSFSDIISEYLSDDFVQCHRSFLVNVNYVQSFTSTEMTLEGYPHIIPIGRKHHKALEERFGAFKRL